MAAGLKFYAPLLFALYGLYGAIFCGLAKEFVSCEGLWGFVPSIFMVICGVLVEI